MHVIVNLCVIPIGVGPSLSSYVAACQRVIKASGLEYQMHANGTNIEGPWDAVMTVVRHCHEEVHRMGAPRISTSMTIGTRTDTAQRMQDKVESVEALLGQEPRAAN